MRKIRRALYWLGLLVGISILVWQIAQMIATWGASRLPLLSPEFLVAAGLALILLIYLQMLNWQMILYGTGYPLGMLELIRGYTLSLIPRYIPGSVWGFISRGEWLNQTYQIPYQVVTFSSVLEVLVTVVSSLMVIGIFLGFSSDGLTIPIPLHWFLVILLPLFVWLLVDRFVDLLRTRQAKHGAGADLKNIPLRVWLACILIYLLQWVILGISILWIEGAFYSIGDGITLLTPRNLNIATYAFSLAWLAGFLILFVPGGIGVREVILSSLIFSNFSIPLLQASLVSLLSRGIYFLAEITWIAIGLLLDFIAKRQN